MKKILLVVSFILCLATILTANNTNTGVVTFQIINSKTELKSVIKPLILKSMGQAKRNLLRPIQIVSI
jgi:hypothetical protein